MSEKNIFHVDGTAISVGGTTSTYSIPNNTNINFFETSSQSYLQYKKLREDSIAPTRSHSGDLGYDLYSVEEVKIPPRCKGIVPTGISFQFPRGWGGIVKDRSSMAMKTTLTTIAGVIDNGYTGELFIAFANYGTEEYVIEKGQKMAQIVLTPVAGLPLKEIETVTSSDGREGNGFGSTGY